MQKTTQVQRLVYRMLTECTGKHFLDSGFSNGRHWQRNQKKTIRDFMREPAEKFFADIREATDKHEARVDISRNVSVFQYLTHSLELDEICDKFNRRNNKPKDWEGGDDKIYGASRRAWDWLTENTDVTVKYTVNTYNHDSDLSQILQYSVLEINDETYFVIQIHNGADARGGYTDAKLFKGGSWAEGIHEYLWEYKSESEIIEDIEQGYITEVYDYFNENELIPMDVLCAALDIEILEEA